MTVADLVKEHNDIDEFIKIESGRFDEHLKKFKERKQEIEQELLKLSLQDKWENQRTEFGTAYRSTLMNLKIEDRDALLKFALDNWEEIGNQLLLVSAQKDAVKEWRQEHPDLPVPGVAVSWFTRINVRRG